MRPTSLGAHKHFYLRLGWGMQPKYWGTHALLQKLPSTPWGDGCTVRRVPPLPVTQTTLINENMSDTHPTVDSTAKPHQHTSTNDLKRGSGLHRACTVHLFYLGNLPDPIVLLVLLSCSPVSP